MPGQQASGGKKNRKWGRNRYDSHRCGPAARKYMDKNVRFENKLRRVLKHNGPSAAQSYDAKYRMQLQDSGKLKKKG